MTPSHEGTPSRLGGKRRARYTAAQSSAEATQRLSRDLRVSDSLVPVRVDLSGFQSVLVAAQLLDAMEAVWNASPPRTSDTFRIYRQAVESLLAVVDADADDPATIRIEDLPGSYCGLAENLYGTDRKAATTSPKRKMAHRLHELLSAIESTPDIGSLSGSMQRTVHGFTGTFARTPHAAKRGSTPVNALSDERRQALTVQCAAEINNYIVTRRMAFEDEGGPMAMGLRWIREHGPGTRSTLPRHVQDSLRSTGMDIVAAQRIAYPTQRDLAPFLVLLLLRTGIEPEGAKGLSRMCLANESSKWVDIEYFKGRAGSEAYRPLRVRNDGHLNAGTLIRLVLDITADAHRHLNRDHLWIAFSPRGRATTARAATPDGMLQEAQFGQVNSEYGALGQLIRAACESASIEPFDIDLRMLRKTKKSDDYRANQGRYPDVASGHSAQVNGNHYADIEAHRDLHVTTIEDGLTQALEVGMRHPRALPALDDETLVEEGLTHEQGVALREGRLTLFTNDCLDFHHSPLGREGDDCPVPFWGCLTCSNAVVREEHLPSVFRFLQHAEDRAETLPPDSWLILFGNAVRNLNEHVLPRFRDSQLAVARVAAAQSPPLTFLPAMPAVPENLT